MGWTYTNTSRHTYGCEERGSVRNLLDDLKQEAGLQKLINLKRCVEDRKKIENYQSGIQPIEGLAH